MYGFMILGLVLIGSLTDFSPLSCLVMPPFKFVMQYRPARPGGDA